MHFSPYQIQIKNNSNCLFWKLYLNWWSPRTQKKRMARKSAACLCVSRDLVPILAASSVSPVRNGSVSVHDKCEQSGRCCVDDTEELGDTSPLYGRIYICLYQWLIRRRPNGISYFSLFYASAYAQGSAGCQSIALSLVCARGCLSAWVWYSAR